MNVIYLGRVEALHRFVRRANEVLVNTQFYERISKHVDFDYTEEKPGHIAGWIKQSTLTVKVKLYKPKDPDTITTAYVSSNYPNTIFINSYRLNRGTGKLVNTIIHEGVHAVDRSLPGKRFGHGDNRWQGKQNSAPYWIGKLAERIINGVKAEDDHSIVENEIEVMEGCGDIEESGKIFDDNLYDEELKDLDKKLEKVD